MDRGVSGLRACRRNRKFRRDRYQTSDASNSASTDAPKERLLREQIRSGASCEDSSTSNTQLICHPERSEGPPNRAKITHASLCDPQRKREVPHFVRDDD